MIVSVPMLNVPFPGQAPKVPTLLSCQVTVCTGTVTIAFAVPPLAQVSAIPLPTVMSTRIDASDPGRHPLWGRLQVDDESLVSFTSLTLKSEPPFESILPMPQPVCVTETV